MSLLHLPASAEEARPAEILDYLVAHGLATPDEAPPALERAGPSNMNCVWRARLSGGRSLILKQARPWVEKYPTIAAPAARAEAEARFYALAAQKPALAACLPRLLHHDAAAHLLVLADLAPVESWETLYAGATLAEDALGSLAAWLAALHDLAAPVADRVRWANREMRALNHAHIYDLPLSSAGPFDSMLESITPGLAAQAARLRADAVYVAAVRALGVAYLAHDHPDAALLHGDLFPGSLLRDPDGVLYVIDPEFCHVGDPAFDVGVFAAHLYLAGQSASVVERWFELAAPASERRARARRHAGVEIMRRLIGVAQLPLRADLETKARLLARSRELVLAE